MCHLEPTAVGVEGMWVWIASGCRERQWVRRVCGCGERQWARRVCGCRERIGRAGNGIRQGFVSGQQVGYGRDGRLVTVGMEGWSRSGWKVGYGRDGRLVMVGMGGWSAACSPHTRPRQPRSRGQCFQSPCTARRRHRPHRCCSARRVLPCRPPPRRPRPAGPLTHKSYRCNTGM